MINKILFSSVIIVHKISILCFANEHWREFHGIIKLVKHCSIGHNIPRRVTKPQISVANLYLLYEVWPCDLISTHLVMIFNLIVR